MYNKRVKHIFDVCHGTLFQVPAPVAGYAFICTCHHVKGFQNCMRYIDGAFEYATYMNYFKYMQMQYLDIRSKASSRLTFDGHGMQRLSSAGYKTESFSYHHCGSRDCHK